MGLGAGRPIGLGLNCQLYLNPKYTDDSIFQYSVGLQTWGFTSAADLSAEDIEFT
ncbi:hypothetical protein PanWU01x14_127090, partial [Parasponia andersonii]